MRKLATAAAVSLALASGGAFGLGLGDIEMRSALNQPMNAEIRLTSVKPGELDGMIVQLASADAFSRAGIERSAVLADLTFSVDSSSGVPVIRIASQRPVVEPFLNFLLEVDWPQGRMVREYTVLLDPPVFMTPSATERNAATDQPTVVQRGEEALIVPTPIDRSATLDDDEFEVELIDVVEETTDATGIDTDDLLVDDGEIVSLGDSLGDSEGEIVSLTDLNAPNTAAIEEREAAASEAFDLDSIEVELVGTLNEVTDDSIVDTTGNAGESTDESTIVSLDDLDQPVELNVPDTNVAANAGSNEATVSQGDTLFEIAESNARAGVSVQQMMIALLAANESAFINQNINLVKAGSILRIPETDEANRLTQAQALAAIGEQNQLWQEYRDSLRDGAATQIAQSSTDSSPSANTDTDTGAETDAEAGTDTIETASLDSDEALDGLSNEAREILENARNEILNRDELRIVADNAPTSTTASATADETTDSNAQRLGEVNRELQLAREELASTRLQSSDLSDQAAELRNTTENLDSLVSLRQNEIAQLEAQLADARIAQAEEAEAAEAEAAALALAETEAQAEAEAVASAESEAEAAESEAEASTQSALADVESEVSGTDADEVITDATTAITDITSDADNAASELVDSASDTVTDAVDTGTNALTEAGEELAQVDLIGDETEVATDSEAVIAPPVKQTSWFQDFMDDPKRMLIAGIGGVGLLGILGTLLFRRRRRDDVAEETLLDIGDEEAFGEDDLPASSVNLGVAGAAVGGAVGGAVAMGAAEHDETLSNTFDELADTSQDLGSETQAVADATSDDGIDKDDTISEVDVYLAYGLHGQAEELLTKAIERNPNQPEYTQKLLQTYHAQGNSEGFQRTAEDFHARFGGEANPEWGNIAAMGAELRPGDPLYSLAQDSVNAIGAGHSDGSALGDDDFLPAQENNEHGSINRDFGGNDDAVDFDDETPLMDQSLDPAFAFDEGDLEATGDFSKIADELASETDNGIEFPGFDDAAPAAAASSLIGDLDSTLDPASALMGDELSTDELIGLDGLDDVMGSAEDLTLDLDQLSGDLELDTSELLNADLSDLDLPDLSADNDLLIDDAVGGASVESADEMDTMLDLAKAYIDMGDKDSASSALGEIVKSGSPEQVTEAETLLRKIS